MANVIAKHASRWLVISESLDWFEACTAANQFKGWRLPTPDELMAFVGTNVPKMTYWTSEEGGMFGAIGVQVIKLNHEEIAEGCRIDHWFYKTSRLAVLLLPTE